MTATALAPQRLFPFVAPDSPFGSAVQALREQAAEGDRPVPPGVRSLVRAEIKGVRTADGWRLDRFSVCTQTWGDGAAPAFVARTLHWRHCAGPARWWELPEEPYLDGLAGVLQGAGRQAPDFEVLRYVPLRRFTWRADGLVHKVKRRSKLADSWARVSAVAAAAEGSGVRVPALRGTTSAPAAYRQDVLTGLPLSQAATGPALLGLLAEAGEVHAAFAELPARQLPELLPDACRPDVARTTDWIGFLLPDLRELTARARTALLTHPPAPDADAFATCHGDLVASHLLGRPGAWSVIDLDLAHRGDRYRDLAMFLAGLPGDVPALTDGTAPRGLLAAAEQAYLSGYAARWGQSLDRRRLAWHRAAAELHHVSLMLTKDGLDPLALGRSTAVLDGLLPEIETGP